MTAHRGEIRRNRAHFAAPTRRNFLSFIARAAGNHIARPRQKTPDII